VSRIRVLVVDDSSFMRGVIARTVASDPRFEVVGQAGDGAQALSLVKSLSPDVVSMDFNMPGVNGAEATRRILAEKPVPIVMLSAHTKEGANATIEALSAGAVDFVAKPDGEVSAHLGEVKEDLLAKLVSASGVNLRSSPVTAKAPAASDGSASFASPAPQSTRTPRVLPSGHRLIVIASSTGGPAALVKVLPALALARAELSTSLVIVQHLPAGFTRALADQLAERSGYPVCEVDRDDPKSLALEPGRAYVAAGGSHLLIDRGGRLRLTDSAPVHGVRPAADVTLASAAQHFGARCLGIVLTGMGKDGARGLASVKAAGGATIAQDKATSTVYGMPKAALELGVVDTVAPLERIAPVVNRLLGA
jgi:two-component system chemotaxis response regulator CheB